MKVKIGKIKANENNPRYIREPKFDKLVNSIKEFPEMLTVRPIVVDENFIVLGGNMRLKACIQAGVKELEIHQVKGWTDEQKREFIIKDNASFGEWDWDVLANEWSEDLIVGWGLDIPVFDDIENEPNEDDLVDEEMKNNPPQMKITFKTEKDLGKAEIEIQELIDSKYVGAYFSVNCGEI